MSAYDDFCGCGEYSCGECFNGSKDAKGNAWEDQIIVETYPNSPLARFAKARLAQYMSGPDDATVDAASTHPLVEGGYSE